MAYVAIKGGEDAIQNSLRVCEYLRTAQADQDTPIELISIENQLRLLHSRVLSEGGVYHPRLASLAIKQAQGDTLEAAFILRASRSTMPRLTETAAMDTSTMRITRRISSAFKDIPGGQMLGATSDYQMRLMRLELLNESPEQFRQICRDWFSDVEEHNIPDSFPKVLNYLRNEGLINELPQVKSQRPIDITRQPLSFPCPRSAILATLTRGEQGAVLAMAYSNMRGYGDIHPTIAELRVGYLPITLPHPITGKPTEVGEIEITECEVVAMYEAPTAKSNNNVKPVFSLGYGACFGHNEVKAISMAILDRSLQQHQGSGPRHPSEDPEFVLKHIDGIDSMGFCTHYKMPHYVTFQSDMDRLRATQKQNIAAERSEKSL